MLVKIPLYYYKVENKETIDWEALGIPEPEEEDRTELVRYDTYVESTEVIWIEPNISDGEGCCIHLKGLEREWLSPLSIEEAAKIINENSNR